LNVVEGGLAIEGGGLRHVGFGDDGHIGSVEDRGVFERLVFSFGRRKEHQAKRLAQVVARGADQVAYVFDEEIVELRQVPAGEGGFDHLGFEMANGSGDDLPDGHAGFCEAAGVIFGGQVADQCSYTMRRSQINERLPEEGGFSRAGAGDEADGENACVAEALAQLPRKHVILLKHLLPDLHDARLRLQGRG